MVTSDWLRITPSRVLTDSLLPTHTTIPHLLDAPDTSVSGDPIPHAVLWAGQLCISDGHHRIARARERGQATILVRVAVPYHHFRSAACADASAS